MVKKTPTKNEKVVLPAPKHRRSSAAKKKKSTKDTDGPIRVVMYCRVSTARQADEGISLEAQQSNCMTYAKLYGLEVVASYVDAGASAKDLSRPQLRRALDHIERENLSGILIAKLDRLTRSLRDLMSLTENEFLDRSIISVQEKIDTTTPSGRLVLRVLGTVSQWEREEVAERTRSVMRYKRERQEFTGGRPPYGYRVVDAKYDKRGKLLAAATLEVDEKEQQALKIVKRCSSRNMSLSDIADQLEMRGLVPRSGGHWTKQGVHRMLACLAESTEVEEAVRK